MISFNPFINQCSAIQKQCGPQFNTSCVPPLFPFETEISQCNVNIINQYGMQLVDQCFSEVKSKCKSLFLSHLRETDLVETCIDKKSFLDKYFSFKSDESEFLKLDKNDKRNKLLFLSAEHDHNGALGASYVYKMIERLDDKYDIKFKIVKFFYEICGEIDEASKIGKLFRVIINGHGSPTSVCLSNCSNYDGERLDYYKDYASCFSGLDLKGKVMLLSCSTGKIRGITGEANIARKIADSINRSVIAPDEDLDAGVTTLSDTFPFIVFSPSEKDATKNSYREFFPWESPYSKARFNIAPVDFVINLIIKIYDETILGLLEDVYAIFTSNRN